MQHINWDNLRYVLMVANKGSISAAARELGVNRSTVLRRIDAFQSSLDCRIFARGDSGYVLTPEAEKMIAAAREVESTLYRMQREIAGHELRLEGELRVTTTDTVMVGLMGPVLASFQAAHPDIVIDIAVTNSVLDLNRRDADVAIRPTQSPEAHLTGYRLRDVEFAPYASPEYLAHHAASESTQHRWIGLNSGFLTTPPGRWLEEHVDSTAIVARGDSFLTVRAACEHGLGVALLPSFVTTATALQALEAPITELTAGLWVLTHPDLFRAARVQAFIDHVRSAFATAPDAA